MNALMLDGLSNFRDVGGLAASSGTIAHGVLYRADSLSSLTELGRAQLAASGVGTVVDFRSTGEIERAPGVAADSVRPVLVTLPLLAGAMPGSAGGLPTLDSLYRDLVDDAGDRFARLASLIATSHDAVLVHCTAGKDRTGVAVALVLRAAGADREAVVADYLVSSDRLAGEWSDRMLAAVRQVGVDITPEIRTLVQGTSAEALESALDAVDATYGGAGEYLLAHGLPREDLERMARRLTGRR